MGSPPTYTSTSSSNSSSSTSNSMLHSVSMANGGSTLLSLGSFSVKSEPVLTTLTPEPDAESEMDESMPHFGLHSMVFSQQQPAHPRLVKDTQSAAGEGDSGAISRSIKQEPSLMMSSTPSIPESRVWPIWIR